MKKDSFPCAYVYIWVLIQFFVLYFTLTTNFYFRPFGCWMFTTLSTKAVLEMWLLSANETVGISMKPGNWSQVNFIVLQEEICGTFQKVHTWDEMYHLNFNCLFNQPGQILALQVWLLLPGLDSFPSFISVYVWALPLPMLVQQLTHFVTPLCHKSSFDFSIKNPNWEAAR